MSTITNEWLQQAINDYESVRDELPFGLDDYQGNILAALRIALASLEAEPSYFVNRVKRSDAYGEDVELRTYCYELDALKSKDDFGGEIVPVYTVPPAPFALPAQHWEELCRQNPDMSIGDAIIRASWWNLCRAAMFQGAEPVTTANKLPFEQWLSQQTGTIDVECGCVMTEVFFHWLRVAYEAGNSPVIPDGWIPVSERMPGSQEWVIVFAKWANQQVLCWDDVANRWTDFEDQSYYADMFTHWMPLPAAPQQEVK